MDLIKFSIKNPVTIIVSVLIVVLFGFLSLSKLPYQLTPNVTKPEIKVTTVWPGATPYEIEKDVAMTPIKLASYDGGSPPVFSADNCTFDPGSGAGSRRY